MLLERIWHLHCPGYASELIGTWAVEMPPLLKLVEKDFKVAIVTDVCS